jgi:hypothetical protein
MDREQMIQVLEAKVRELEPDSPTGGYVIWPKASNSRQAMIRNYNRNVVGDWKRSK